jgi:DNA-binding transcriptional ArsR family regulator
LIFDLNLPVVSASVITLSEQGQFVYHQNVNVEHSEDLAVARIASAIGEPARARMLFCLMDGHARTSTELATVAEVGMSTASAHLNRLKGERLVKVVTQGKHRFYSLDGPKVARVLEGLSVLVGQPRKKFLPNTPTHLRGARVCYDHMAGHLGVLLHDRLLQLRWLSRSSKTGEDNSYDLTVEGVKALEVLGLEVEEIRRLRRRFAYACLDWSERRPHLGGALGSALLKAAVKRKWVIQDLDSRAIRITNVGRRDLLARFGLDF